MSQSDSCDAREKIFQDPRKSWPGEFDGWFRIYLEKVGLEFRIIARNHKVDAEKFECVGEGLKFRSSEWWASGAAANAYLKVNRVLQSRLEGF